jgi:site-specific DNA-methyltransferase (adenine-specific)
MKQIEDKSVDLVLTDPPYGIGAGKEKEHNGWKDYGYNTWDEKPPSKEYFEHIIRISKNQIIFGGNYFTEHLPPSQGWIVWDKGQRDFSLADGELAWTNFDKALRIFSYSRASALKDGKVHPTQKPLALMMWCLEKYSKPGMTVLDPFMGSGTTCVACKKLGRNFIGIEKEPAYIAIAEKRLEKVNNHKIEEWF